MSHIHDLIDFTVEVFIVHGGEVLLRRHDKYDLWLSVGGHVELDEDPTEAALREVEEEVGLDVSLYDGTDIPKGERDGYSELVSPVHLYRHPVSDEHDHVVLVYYASATSRDVDLSDEEVAEAVRWCSPDDLDGMELRENVEWYARDAIQNV